MVTLKIGKWYSDQDAGHVPAGFFHVLVTLLWIMRTTVHMKDTQNTKARFSGVPKLEYRIPFAIPQPIVAIQIKKI